MISPAEAAALASIDPATMLAQVEAWCAINSGSRNLAGLETTAATLAAAFAALGTMAFVDPAPATQMTADGQERPLPHGRNLHLSVRPNAATRVLLTGHMDTVFAVDHPFQSLRWLDGNTLNGPGVADMKGGIAVMLAALAAFESSPDASRLGYEIILNADEEVSSLGSAPLLAAAAARVHLALTYEPSALPDGTLAGARPGSGNFSVHLAGRSAHAGRNPQDGRNAIVAAADLALRLAALRSPELKVNVAKIDGGAPNNVVPDNAVLRVNLRPSTPQAQAEASAAMDAAIAAVALAHDVSAHRHGGFARPPKPLDENQLRLFHLVRDTGTDLGLNIAWQPAGGVCDGNNLAATGLAVVDTLGVRGGAIHSDAEFLLVDSLAERARLSALLLMRLAARGFPRAA
ncbi:hydrolase [Sandaracinobacteroides saxicola]|uniref:Hydrolase n=1 Tax=Sandaracinobacteroides saxicola TaxID=2759707 RepID=A0A7G5II07_9SPHN|nr:hydrolase [Sandaracinobacteroides saxicola]QMW22999.1 hydrolase [Sandaracinobacteroides saxicola]